MVRRGRWRWWLQLGLRRLGGNHRGGGGGGWLSERCPAHSARAPGPGTSRGPGQAAPARGGGAACEATKRETPAGSGRLLPAQCSRVATQSWLHTLRRIPARDCCSQLSALLQLVSWLCSFALCFGQSPFPPLPHPRHGTAPGSGPRGGRAQWARVGPPAKTAGIAGLSLHTGDCLRWRTVGEGRLSKTRRPGTAPRPGRGGAEGTSAEKGDS